MDRTRWLKLVVLLGLATVSISCFLIRLAIIREKSVNYPRIIEFFACGGPDPITGLPQEPITVQSASRETLYACGYLEADGKVSLGFLIDYEVSGRGWFAVSKRYQSGYVFEEIPKHFWHKPGHYLVEVWWNRLQLASTEFQVVEEHE